MPLKLLTINPDTPKFLSIAREQKVKLESLFMKLLGKKKGTALRYWETHFCHKSGKNTNCKKLKI